MDHLASRNFKKNAGFVGLKDDEKCDGDDFVEEILLSDADAEFSHYEEEVTEEDVVQNADPFVVKTWTQSALTVPISNLARHPANSTSELRDGSEHKDLAMYAELAVAKMVADQESRETQSIEPRKVELFQSETRRKSGGASDCASCPSDEPPSSRIYPKDDPPPIIPVPIFQNEELAMKPLAFKAAGGYYCDPSATLIIQSFKARSAPFVSHDDLSDISPALHSCDETANSGDEVILPNDEAEPSSSSETGSDSMLIQVNDRSDDPEAGCKQIATSLRKAGDKKPRALHHVLAFLLFTFVCSATGYLVVYVVGMIKNGNNAQLAVAGGQNQTLGGNTDIFVGAKPTTPMGSFTPDCRFDDYAQPNVVQLCACNSEISLLSEEVRQKYYALNMFFIDLNISEVWDLPEESCDPRNQAMVWLATTYAKDQHDLVQKYVLASFFFQTAGEQWVDREGWLADRDLCNWAGVSCNDKGSVASIFMDRNKVKGSIPSELFILQSLESLSLRDNAITGAIPSTLFSMPYINEINLSFNNLVGTLPPEIALASNLEVLRLDMNSLEGNLAPLLGRLSLLRKLNLGFNSFSGTLPLELFQLMHVEELVLESNTRITGRLPPEMGNLISLQHLDISSTSILARIPTQVGFLTSLRILKAAESQMSGIIPTEIARLTNLNHLDLSRGGFRRGIPSVFGQLPLLTYLALNDNDLTGRIPSQLGNMTELVHLSLHGNQLFGEIPKHLGYLTMLDTLTLEENNLTGRAPREVCNLRREELIAFTTDCSDGSEGVLCPVPNCCTSCAN